MTTPATTLELSRLGHQFCSDLAPSELRRVAPEAAVRSFLYSQSGIDSAIDSSLEEVTGGNRVLARALTDDAARMRHSYHARELKETVPGRKFLAFPAETWKSIAQAASPAKRHDINHFRETRQRMTEIHECSQFVDLTNAAASSPGLSQGALITLYATGNAGDRRRDEVCRALASSSMSAAQLFDLQTKHVTAAWKSNPAEANRQLKTILAAVSITADGLSLDAADIDAMLAAASPPTKKKALIAAPLETPTEHVAEISLRNDGLMDNPADAIVKAFCHRAGVPVDQHRDSHRRVYLTAGLRNASSLVDQDAATFSPHVRDFIKAISAVPTTHADVHRPEFFPAVVDTILEEPLTRQPLTAAKRTLMREVNEFMSSVFGPATCEDASLLKTNSIRLWLLANSAGPSWSAASLNLIDTEEAAYRRYLTATKGPSIDAMMALKQLYMPLD